MSAQVREQPVQDLAAITAYKGFDHNLQCRGFQFELQQTYTHEGKVKTCESGFHACEYPLATFGYYAPAESRYADVSLSGRMHSDGLDTKIAAASITINAELRIPELVKRAIAWITERCNPAKAAHSTRDLSASSVTGDLSASSATGDRSASSVTGDRSASSVTGDLSASSATGDRSASSVTGYRSASSATGYQSASSATGDLSASSATGDRSASSVTGDLSASSATGDRSASSVTGYQSASSATGDRSASSATGDLSASSATGDLSASSATGDLSASSATGYRSAATNTGNYGSAEILDGERSSFGVAVATGYEGKAKASPGSAIVLVHRDDDGAIVHIRAAVAGQDVKSDTWYALNAAGEFVEVTP